MRRIALVGLLSAASACSLTTYDYTSCDTNADCRDAFGFGYVCGDEGLLVLRVARAGLAR